MYFASTKYVAGLNAEDLRTRVRLSSPPPFLLLKLIFSYTDCNLRYANLKAVFPLQAIPATGLEAPDVTGIIPVFGYKPEGAV